MEYYVSKSQVLFYFFIMHESTLIIYKNNLVKCYSNYFILIYETHTPQSLQSATTKATVLEFDMLQKQFHFQQEKLVLIIKNSILGCINRNLIRKVCIEKNLNQTYHL